MSDEKYLREELLPAINELFMRNGIKAVTMDDVARHLRVSKKTLYKYVKDKKDLVGQCTRARFLSEQEQIDEIMKKGLNAVDEIYEISRFISLELQQIHPSIFYDLEKYYTESWYIFLDFKNEYVLDTIRENLNKGIKEGLYRDDLHVEIISRLYVGLIDQVLNTQVFPSNEYSRPEVYLEMFRYHLQGISSPEGLGYLTRKIKEEKEKLK